MLVIDFIGNYKNNYLIPIALYGDKTYNKDRLRKLVSEGSKMIPGSSTINFDEITKDRIFKSIDSAKMALVKDLRKDFHLLKTRLGRIPMMMDFVKNGFRDPFLYVDYARSYYNFVYKEDDDLKESLDERSIKLLELFSKEINNSKRVEESILLQVLIIQKKYGINQFKNTIKNKYGYSVSDETINSCISNLNFEFIREKKDKKLFSVRNIWNFNIVIKEKGIISFHPAFKKTLENSTFKRFLSDSVEYAISVYDQEFDLNKWDGGFVRYRKYSRKDVFRILNLAENPVAQNVGGYLVSQDEAHCPIFVNYHKDEDISASTKYEDQFVNNKEFDWMSKSNRKLNSKDVKSILNLESGIRLPLFIKKSNDEGQNFYYMGKLSPQINNVEQTKMKTDSGKSVSVVKIRFNMESPVEDSIYTYLTDTTLTTSPPVDILPTEIKPLKNIGSHQSLFEEKPAAKIRILHPKEVKPYVNSVPIYDLYAAAGGFSDLQSNPDKEWVELPSKFKPNETLFVCKVIGESMNKVIPNGSFCIFKKYQGGSRNNLIVLVQNFDRQDPDFLSSFTVKRYFSEKKAVEGSWGHSRIVLKAESYDSGYEDVVIEAEDGDRYSVVGEFLEVL